MTKLLLASGCSYTAVGENKSWPDYLSSSLECNHINYARISAGNRYISSSIIYGVTEALKTHSPGDILVGVIWSGISRGSIFKTNINTNHITCSWPSHNPIGFIDTNWIITNHHWDDRVSTAYYSSIYDDVGGEIESLEHVLRVQWFLESKKIKYFMSTFAPGSIPKLPNKHTEHLIGQVDWTKFLPIDNYMSWCIGSNIPVAKSDEHLPLHFMHPTVEHHTEFVNKIIVPFIGNQAT